MIKMHITHEGRAVAKAIALLNKKGPADWRDRVDLEKLDLRSLHNCVLGQVFRNGHGYGHGYGYGYDDGTKALGIAYNEVFASNRYLDQWRKQIKRGRR